MGEQVGTRRRRSPVDGILRSRCTCGRLMALDEDWRSPDIDEGARDDLCWGIAANHEFDWPPKETA